MEGPVESSTPVRQGKSLPPPLTKLPLRSGTAPSSTCLSPRSSSMKSRSPASPSISISSSKESPSHPHPQYFNPSTSNHRIEETEGEEEEEEDDEIFQDSGHAYAKSLHFPSEPQYRQGSVSPDPPPFLPPSSPSSTGALHPISENVLEAEPSSLVTLAGGDSSHPITTAATTTSTTTFTTFPTVPTSPTYGSSLPPESPISTSSISPAGSDSSRASSVLMRYKSTSPNQPLPLPSSSMTLADLTETLDHLLDNVSSTSLDLRPMERQDPGVDASPTLPSDTLVPPAKNNSFALSSLPFSASSPALTDVEPHGISIDPAAPTLHMRNSPHSPPLPPSFSSSSSLLSPHDPSSPSLTTPASTSSLDKTLNPLSLSSPSFTPHPPPMTNPSTSDLPIQDTMLDSLNPISSAPDASPSSSFPSSSLSHTQKSKDGTGGNTNPGRSLSKTLLSTFRSPSSAKRGQFRSFFSSSSSSSSFPSSSSSSSSTPSLSTLDPTSSPPPPLPTTAPLVPPSGYPSSTDPCSSDTKEDGSVRDKLASSQPSSPPKSSSDPNATSDPVPPMAPLVQAHSIPPPSGPYMTFPRPPVTMSVPSAPLLPSPEGTEDKDKGGSVESKEGEESLFEAQEQNTRPPRVEEKRPLGVRPPAPPHPIRIDAPKIISPTLPSPPPPSSVLRGPSVRQPLSTKENQGLEKQWMDQILLESSSFTRISPQDFSQLVEEERVLTSRISILAEAHVRESRIRDSATSLANLHHSNKKNKKKAQAELLVAESKVSRVLVDLWRLEGKRAEVRQQMGRARSVILRDGLQASEDRCRKLEAAREVRRKSVVQSVHARESMSLSSQVQMFGEKDGVGSNGNLASTAQILALRSRVEELEGVLLETNEELTRARQERKGAVELMEEERRRVVERDREIEEVGRVVRKLRSVGEGEWTDHEGRSKVTGSKEHRASISPMVARLQGLQEDLERSEVEIKSLKSQLVDQDRQYREEIKRLRSALPQGSSLEHSLRDDGEGEESSQESSISGDGLSVRHLVHQGSKDSLSAGIPTSPTHHRQGSHSTQYTSITSQTAQTSSTFRPGSSGSGRPGTSPSAPSALCRMLTRRETECRDLRDKLVELRKDIRELELGQEEMIAPLEELWEELPHDPQEPHGSFTLPAFLSRVSRLIYNRSAPPPHPLQPESSGHWTSSGRQEGTTVEAIFRAAQEVGEVFGKPDGHKKRMDDRELASIHASLSPTTSPPLSPTSQTSGLGHPLIEGPNGTYRGRTDISALLTKLEDMQRN